MSFNNSIGTPEQLSDPDYTPPLAQAIPLGIQHVLAMFVSNVTPAILVCGAAGFGFGSNSPDFPQMIYMMQLYSKPLASDRSVHDYQLFKGQALPFYRS